MASNVVRDASGAITGYYSQSGQFVPIESVRQQSSQNQGNVTLTPVTYSHDAQGNVVTKEVKQLPKPFISSVPNQQQPQSTPSEKQETKLPAPYLSKVTASETDVEAAMNRGDIPKPYRSGTLVSTEIVPASGEVFGYKVPIVSDVLSFVSPQSKVRTYDFGGEESKKTITTVESPELIQTNVQKQTFGNGTTITSTERTFGTQTKTETQTETSSTKSTISEPHPSPLDLLLRRNMTAPGSLASKDTTNAAVFVSSLLPGGMAMSFINKEIDFIDTATKGASKPYTSFIPMSPGYMEDMYKNVYESPSVALGSAAIGAALPVAGMGLKATGAGTAYLAPGSTGGAIYQTASKVGTAGLLGVYGSDVSKRVFGVTPGEIQQQFLPGIDEDGTITSANGPSAAVSLITENFPGVEKSRQEINKITTLELAPMTLGFSAGSAIDRKVTGLITTKGLPEIKNARSSGYESSEGFPTNVNIKTADLVDSFKTGTITLKNPAKMADTIMAPTGTKITRIPTGSQIGASPKETYVFTGAEYPFLRTGFIGESASELPAMFTAPQRIAYFSKAGQSQAGGFGISSDVFGIYNRPTIYRSVVEQGKYQQIPDTLLNAPNPTNPITGKAWSTNDPLNPKNLKIADWITKTAEPGVPIIGQYGKSEWQFLISSGSEVAAAKPTGFIRDAGVRIPQYDVTFTGKKSPLYSPTGPTTNPKGIVVGKMFGGVGYAGDSSFIGSRQRIPTISIPSIDTTYSGASKTTTRSTKQSVDYSISKSISESSSIISKLADSSISKSKSTSDFTSDIYSGKSSTDITSKISSGFDDQLSTSKSFDDSIITSTDSSKTTSDFSSIFSSGRSSKITTDITSDISRYSGTTRVINKVFWGLAPPAGGFGRRYGGFQRATFWKRINPVADKGYLSKGFGKSLFGSGRSNGMIFGSMDTSFGFDFTKQTAKKRRKSSRRKK